MRGQREREEAETPQRDSEMDPEKSGSAGGKREETLPRQPGTQGEPSKTAVKPETAQKEEKPKETAQKEEKSKETAQKEEKSKETAQKEEKPKETAQKEEKPKETAQKEEKPKETAQKEEKSKETAQKEEKPKETAQKEEKSKETAQKEEKSKETAQKEEKPKETAQKEEKLKETAQKEEKSKETAQKEEKSKETAQKEEKPKETAQKEEKPKETAQEKMHKKTTQQKETDKEKEKPKKTAQGKPYGGEESAHHRQQVPEESAHEQKETSVNEDKHKQAALKEKQIQKETVQEEKKTGEKKKAQGTQKETAQEKETPKVITQETQKETAQKKETPEVTAQETQKETAQEKETPEVTAQEKPCVLDGPSQLQFLQDWPEPETAQGWLDLCDREWGLTKRDIQLPESADWRDIYKKRPFGRNFLKSPNPEGLSTSQPPPREECDPPPQKKPLETLGDFRGWQISTEEIPVDRSKVPEGVVVCYLPVYSWCVKEQVVDLVAEGLWEDLLDSHQPDIYVLDWYEDSKLHRHVYELHVTLLAADKTTVISRYDVTPENDMSGDLKGWNLVSHVFKSYGSGVRFIRFLHKSKDLSVLGFHRTRLADSTVFAQLRGDV